MDWRESSTWRITGGVWRRSDSDELGDYRLAFITAGALCLIAGASFIVVGRRALGVAPQPANAFQ